MSSKIGHRMVFYLSVICTEIAIYLIIFGGISIIAYQVFKEFSIFQNAILSLIIEMFGIWGRYIEGFYLERYKKYVEMIKNE